jgi:uncharacterized membrane protein YbhN (UPF0104 family)
MKIRKILLFLIGLAVGLVVFGLISGDIDWASVGESFSSIRWWQLLLLLGLMEGSMVFAALAWKSILEEKRSLPFFPLLKIFTVGFSLSYLTPMTLVGGEALRAYFLHQKEHLSWKKTIISIILHKLIIFLVLAGVVSIGLGFFFFLGGALSRRLGSLIFLIFLGMAIFLFLLFRHSSNHQSLISSLFLALGLGQVLEIKQMKTVLAYEKEALRFFRTRRQAFWQAVGFSALEALCYLGQAFFIIAFLSGKWTVIGALISYAFSGLSAFFILPAALGSLEVMEGFAFQSLGLELSLALTFSLIWRGLRLLICFSGGLIALQLMREIGWKSLRESKKQYLQHAREPKIS